MAGLAESSNLPAELQQPQTEVLIYHGSSWQFLQPGLGWNSSYFGPEITFGRDLASSQPDEKIMLIKYAVGGTHLWGDWKAPDADGHGGGPQYIAFLDTVADALASIDPAYEPEIAGMIWMQGESDAWPSQSTMSQALEYETNLGAFIQSIRSDLTLPDMPFAIGQISESWVWTYGDIVRQAQFNISQTVPNTTLVVTSDLPIKSDAMHYTSEGMMTLGSRFSDAMMPIPEPATLCFLGLGYMALLRKQRVLQ